jgi:membrane protease subunit HflK
MHAKQEFDFDAGEFIQYHLRRLRNRLGGAGIGFGVLGLIVLIGIFSSYYTVPTDSQAVVKRFGEVVAVTGPGLHFKLPFGIDTAETVAVTRVRKQEFGYRTVEAQRKSRFEQQHADESQMLTGDLNVIEVEWAVQYRVARPDGKAHPTDPADAAASRWLHAVRDQKDTIRDISEAVMRRVIGNRLAVEALTRERAKVQQQVLEEMRRVLEDYEMGVRITAVNLQQVRPPTREVRAAYNEVNEAQQQREQLINEAKSYRNEVVPQARGQAAQIVANAKGYKAERVNAAKGEATRFTALLKEYRQGKEITRRRMYLEMVDQVMPSLGKLYIMDSDQTRPLPLLNLDRGKSVIGGSK